MSNSPNATATHLSARQAKAFLISTVIREAEMENVSMSELEKKMLHFTEFHESLPDIYEVNAKFEEECNSKEYEAKISSLIRNAYQRDQKESSGRIDEWWHAIRSLKMEDHYIVVMLDQAGLKPPGDTWRLFGTAMAVVGAFVILVVLSVNAGIPDEWNGRLALLFTAAVVVVWVVLSPMRRRMWAEAIRGVLGGLALWYGWKPRNKQPRQ